MPTIDERPIDFNTVQTREFVDNSNILTVRGRDFLLDLWRRTGGVQNGLISNVNISESGTTVTIKSGSTFNVAGTFQLGGITVTTNANELNTFDGIDTTPVDGALLIGNSGTNKYDTATLTAGSGVTITNSAGGITLSATPFYYTETFTSQTTITVTHNLGVYPNVQVLDGSDNLVIPNAISHSSVNEFVVTFSSSRSGRILAVTGVAA